MIDSDAPPKVTVLTATYNRAHTLPRLYESLLKQSFKDFEWVIIDDGSNDATTTLAETWAKKQGFFDIKYFWYENRGKHVAINRGVGKARGEFCAVIDSDDWYPPTALTDLVTAWENIPIDIRSKYANVEGLGVKPDGSLIGSKFPTAIYDSDNFEIRLIRKEMGDTQGMYRTDILRQFPFPEEFRFVREGLVWNRIAEKYRTRFINMVVGIKEYQEDGLTRGGGLSVKIRRGESSILYYQELLGMNRHLPLEIKKEAVVAIACLAMHHRKNLLTLFLKNDEKVLFSILFPISFARFLKQKLKLFLIEKKVISDR